MIRKVIAQGSPTSTGGKVLQGNVGIIIDDAVNAASVGHMTSCPVCQKGQGAIVALGSRLIILPAGPVALAGDYVACGCPPNANTVIAAQSTVFGGSEILATNEAVEAKINKNQPRDTGKVYITGHLVSETFSDEVHLAIEFTDKKGSEWISAGPDGYWFWDLKSGQEKERPTDEPANNFTVGEVTPPAGMSNAEYFELLKDTDIKYCDCADYDLSPDGDGDGYNSNSYIRGIIEATGGTASINFNSYQGGEKPLPPLYFKNKNSPQ